MEKQLNNKGFQSNIRMLNSLVNQGLTMISGWGMKHIVKTEGHEEAYDNKKVFLTASYYIVMWTFLYVVIIFILSHDQIKKEFT